MVGHGGYLLEVSSWCYYCMMEEGRGDRGGRGDAVQPVVSSLGRRTFPYLCSDGSRTFCLLLVDITFEVLE